MSKVELVKGNIFQSKCEAYVCPVNTVGVMGKGLAKLFKENKKFNGSNEAYIQACRTGELGPGSVYLGVNDLEPEEGSYVFYIATKHTWQKQSKLEWIEIGLFNLLKALNHYKINSVAVPALGCGNGGLPWPTVEMMIKSVFLYDNNPDRKIEVYEPM